MSVNMKIRNLRILSNGEGFTKVLQPFDNWVVFYKAKIFIPLKNKE